MQAPSPPPLWRDAVWRWSWQTQRARERTHRVTLAHLPPQYNVFSQEAVREMIRFHNKIEERIRAAAEGRAITMGPTPALPDGSIDFAQDWRLEGLELLPPTSVPNKYISPAWETALFGWGIAALLFFFILFIIRLAEMCIDNDKSDRRQSEEWPTPNVLATSNRNTDNDINTRLETSEALPSPNSNENFTNSDMPPPYSECFDIADLNKDIVDEPPPPYSACYVAFANPKDGIPSVHIYNSRRQNISENILSGRNFHNTRQTELQNLRIDLPEIVNNFRRNQRKRDVEAHIELVKRNTEANIDAAAMPNDIASTEALSMMSDKDTATEADLITDRVIKRNRDINSKIEYGGIREVYTDAAMFRSNIASTETKPTINNTVMANGVNLTRVHKINEDSVKDNDTEYGINRNGSTNAAVMLGDTTEIMPPTAVDSITVQVINRDSDENSDADFEMNRGDKINAAAIRNDYANTEHETTINETVSDTEGNLVTVRVINNKQRNRNDHASIEFERNGEINADAISSNCEPLIATTEAEPTKEAERPHRVTSAEKNLVTVRVINRNSHCDVEESTATQRICM